MRAVQAVNIGYSPKHAAPPPVRPPDGPRRLRTMALLLVAVALLSAGTVAVLRSYDNPALCRSAVGTTDCPAGSGLSSASLMRVMIDSGPAFGLREPAAITIGRGHLWLTDSVRDSVTEVGWRAGSSPVIWSAGHYGFSSPGAITAGRNELWIANAGSITEMSTINGKVIRIVPGGGWLDSPRALVLFGSRLWIANASSVAELNTTTGKLIAVFRSPRYGFGNPA